MKTNVTKNTIKYLKNPNSCSVNNKPLFFLYMIYKENKHINKKSLFHILKTTPTSYQQKIKILKTTPTFYKNKDGNKKKDKNKIINEEKHKLLKDLYINGLINLGLIDVVKDSKNISQVILKPSPLGKEFIIHFKKYLIDKYVKLDNYLNKFSNIFCVPLLFIASVTAFFKHESIPIIQILAIILLVVIISFHYTSKFDKLVSYRSHSFNRYIKKDDIIKFLKQKLSSKDKLNNDITMLASYKICKK